MSRKPLLLLLVTLLALLHLTLTLHFGQPRARHFAVDQQLAALRDQQGAFQKQIAGLVGNINDIETRVKATSVTNDKVILLESAVLSQRETIFQIQNSLIPPFNLSKNACRELTNDQKIKLLDQLLAARNQLAQLKLIASRIPANAQLNQITADLAKQDTLVASIEKMIYTKCESTIVLTPTIFQSNLYATNWILGGQTIDDIVEQYYQRSRLYHNVTNCPIQYPFFNGQVCVLCQNPTPIFNMEAGYCQKCPFDTQVNVDKRICEQIPHYTDYTKIDNYNLDGATAFPTPPAGITPCLSQKPFWNAVICIKCTLPSYWSVKDNQCKDCSPGNVFNLNTKTCTVPLGDSITYLETSRWVTNNGNFTNVLAERANLLKTKTPYYCGKDTPYYDGIACISCPNEFSLADKKCVTAPQGLVYDNNLHAYIPGETGKTTNLNGGNLLSSLPLPQPTGTPCNQTNPYFDGIACIQCPQPYPLFDLPTKRCVQCSPFEVYDPAKYECKKRLALYISSNFTSIVATSRVTLPAYKAEILYIVKNSGDAIILKCKPEQYSNYTNCFPCLPTQKFNIDTKACDTCNGTIDPTTYICDPLKTLLTNPTSPNLLLPSTTTIQAFAQAQKGITGPTATCPTTSPYAVQGLQCISCVNPTLGIYFDLQAQKCVNCPPTLYYNPSKYICEKSINISNIAALKNYIEVDNYTIANLQSQQTLILQTRATFTCPAATPIASAQGDLCTVCVGNSYVNLKTLQCVDGKLLTNPTAIQATKRFVEIAPATLASIVASNQQAAKLKNIYPVTICPDATPLSTGGACISCPADQYYDLLKGNCYIPTYSTNVPALTASKLYLEFPSATLAGINTAQSSNPYPTLACPADFALYDVKATKCIGCQNGNYYILSNYTCYNPEVVTNIAALSASKNYVESGTATLAKIDEYIKKQTLPVASCPVASPLYNGFQCISCPVEQYYGLQGKSCLNAVMVSNFDALTVSNNYIQKDANGLVNLKLMANKLPEPKKVCPAQQPLFNGSNCISCPPSQSLYNLQSMQCSQCVAGFAFDQKTHTCIKKPDYSPNLANGQWIVSTDKGVDQLKLLIQQRQAIVGSSQCPANTPHFNNINKDCQACPVGNYFNYQTYVCMACPVPQELDINTHRCGLRLVGVYQTSLNSKNLLFEGRPKAQFLDYYNNNRIAYPNIKDCPPATPYFDGFVCLLCPPTSPLFSMPTQLCSSCPIASAYNQVEKQCSGSKGELKASDPTMGKMYSSIF